MKSIKDIVEDKSSEICENTSEYEVYRIVDKYFKEVAAPAIQKWISHEYSNVLQSWLEEEALPEFEEALKNECFGDPDYSRISEGLVKKIKTYAFR